MKAKVSLTKQEAELEASENEVKAFFDGIIPDFVKEGGGIITDNVRFWRWQNQVRIVKKAKQILEDNNLDKQKIPLKVLHPLLESSSLEEDESMQGKWSNLLANAAASTHKVTPNYIEILKELSPIEAKVLDTIYDESTRPRDNKNILQFSTQKICEYFGIPAEESEVMVQNLYRLGLCSEPGSTGMTFGEARVALRTTDIFEITSLGVAFVKACREPQHQL